MGTFYIASPELTYIHIPRTGMGMKYIIRDYLKPNFKLNDTDPWMINHPSLKHAKEVYSTGKYLGIVRNPWQRIWSFYKKIRDEGYWKDWSEEHQMGIKPFNDWILDYGNPEVDFTFPRWFTRFTNMWEFLVDNDGKYAEFIIKAENIEKDIKPVQEYLGIRKPLPDISFTYNHYEYRNYFDDSSRKVVDRMFEKDLDIFKYVF